MNDQTSRPRTPSSERNDEVCGICGGDRRIGNSFGLTTTCPSCHGTGRRLETAGFHDVTKTKASHYLPNQSTNKSEAVAKALWPVTFEGAKLATEVRESTTCAIAVKDKLVREIIDYEDSHGQCTQTFIKKVRKQIRPRGSP
ncbi:MAG: molecular chaperone DnaJ [Myxococcota bacterium]|nr:molecular chaperone DnaJ [Myxococcota bacterium]